MRMCSVLSAKRLRELRLVFIARPALRFVAQGAADARQRHFPDAGQALLFRIQREFIYLLCAVRRPRAGRSLPRPKSCNGH